MISEPYRRIVLVGFMGAGKTSVGREVGRRLGWTFVDLDAEIERRAELPIPEIFATLGEPYFRAIEEEEAALVLSREECVIATGGGWGAQPGRLDRLPAGTLSVWLSVTPEEAVRRASSEPGRRPLLTGGDVLGIARTLVEKREPEYRRAAFEVDTSGLSVEDVSARILDFVAASSPAESVE